MNPQQILAQLASDTELGEGSCVGDNPMTVGVFGRDVHLEVGPVACVLSSHDAFALAAYLGRGGEWAPFERACTLDIVEVCVRWMHGGEVQVDLQADDAPDAVWHGRADRLREAIGRALLTRL